MVFLVFLKCCLFVCLYFFGSFCDFYCLFDKIWKFVVDLELTFWLFCFMILSSILLLIMLHSLLITMLCDTFKCYWLSLFILYEWTLWIIFKMIDDLKGLFWHFFRISSLKFFGLFNFISYYSLLWIAFLLILYHSKLSFLSYLRKCCQNWNSCIFGIPGIYIYIYIYIIYILYIIF